MINNVIFKVPNTHPNLHRWCTLKGNNPFVPVLDTPIWIDHIDRRIIDEVLEVVKSKESLYKNNQWEHYNIFLWEEECISVLKLAVKEIYLKFLNELNLPPEKSVYVNSWVFPQKKGQKLRMHTHAIHENAYLSANIVLTDNKTTTDFDIPYISVEHGLFSVENSSGKVTIFPSYLPHKVDTLDDDFRYTIGIDFITERGIECFKKNSNNPASPLYRATLL